MKNRVLWFGVPFFERFAQREVPKGVAPQIVWEFTRRLRTLRQAHADLDATRIELVRAFGVSELGAESPRFVDFTLAWDGALSEAAAVVLPTPLAFARVETFLETASPAVLAALVDLGVVAEPVSE